MQKPSIPKGTRDFGPQEMARRNYIFDTIREVFRLYGFEQIETPAMENLSTLMGKYGEEGDKLLFKILDSGEFLNNVEAGARGLTNTEINNILMLDNDIIFNALNFIVTELKKSTSIEDIEKKYLDNKYSKELQNLRKFILFRNSRDIRTKDEVIKYLSYIKNINKYKGFIKNSTSQTRKGLFKESTNIVRKISEKGLRYDLTVPFARFVVQHRDKIAFPFKRYQIQPVWRADRPQKGRYREFYQCDVDVVGSNSLINELELIQIIDLVYRRLKINVCIKINNRKVLSGIAEMIGEAQRITDITVAIDKLDKIGLEKVNEEIASKGVSQEAIDKLQPVLLLSGSNIEKLEQLKTVLHDSEIGLKGVAELETILSMCETACVETKIELDLTLARGLNYYTGAIFEVKALDVEIGSITGGGRYDNLTGVFGLNDMSGVGISFGADRIYDVLNQLNLYPERRPDQTQVLFVSFGEKELAYSLKWANVLREKSINTEVYPELAKMKKQMSYADNKQIPFVAIVGETEMAEQKVMLKNMHSGEQKLVDIEALLKEVSGI